MSPHSPAKVRLITRAYRLDLFLAGSFDIIHMNNTAAVATLDKVLQIKVGIVIAGCHGMVPSRWQCNLRRRKHTRNENKSSRRTQHDSLTKRS